MRVAFFLSACFSLYSLTPRERFLLRRFVHFFVYFLNGVVCLFIDHLGGQKKGKGCVRVCGIFEHIPRRSDHGWCLARLILAGRAGIVRGLFLSLAVVDA